MYPVNRGEKYVKKADDKFSIQFQLIRTEFKSNILPPTVEYNQDSLGRTIVTFIPQMPGDYKIHITSKKQPISMSPFDLVVIQSENSHAGIREMAYSGWEVEAASTLASLVSNKDKDELVFSVGVGTLIHLLGSSDPGVQKDMNTIFCSLLEKEENQIRIATDGSIQLLNKILKSPYWLQNDKISSFISRLLSFALETNTTFRKHFLQNISVEPLLTLAYNENIESVRFAVKSLFVISAHTDNIVTLLNHSLFLEAIVRLLEFEDVILKRYCLHILYNLTKAKEFISLLNERKIKLLASQLITHDRRLQLDVLMIMSEINSPLITKIFIEDQLYVTVYDLLSIESTIQAWEFKCFENSIEDTLSEHLMDTETKLQSDINTLSLRFFNVVLTNSTKPQLDGISDHILTYKNGNILDIICQLAGSIEIRVQKEACKILCYLVKYKETGIYISQSDGFLWLCGSFSDADMLRQKYLFETIAKISYYFDSEISLPDDSLLEVLFSYVNSHDLYLSDNSITTLAHLCKNLYYREICIKTDKKLICNIVKVARDNLLNIHNQIDWKDIIIDENDNGISSDALSKVKICEYNGKKYAIKFFHENDIQFNINEFRAEVAIMSLCKHPNIAFAIGASTIRSNNLFIISELYSKGNLSFYLKNSKNIMFKEVVSMMLDAAKGIEFLHSLGLIHRDIKPSNFLVGDNNKVVLTDFGTTRESSRNMTPTVGTALYMAPDLVESTKYTKKVDVYSFGISLWEVMERRFPYPSSQAIDIIFAAKDGIRPDFSFDSPLKELIESCWNGEPNERPSFSEIIKKLENILNEEIDFELPSPSEGKINPTPKYNSPKNPKRRRKLVDVREQNNNTTNNVDIDISNTQNKKSKRNNITVATFRAGTSRRFTRKRSKSKTESSTFSPRKRKRRVSSIHSQEEGEHKKDELEIDIISKKKKRKKRKDKHKTEENKEERE